MEFACCGGTQRTNLDVIIFTEGKFIGGAKQWRRRRGYNGPRRTRSNLLALARSGPERLDPGDGSSFTLC